MLVKAYSVTSFGMKIIKVIIEVNVSERGFPGFDIVGLAGKEVFESRQRVITALSNCGYRVSDKKITVNLAPADMPKDGSFYDLPIAACLISAMTNVPLPKDSLFFGELSLDGSLQYSNGAFLVALYAKDCDFTSIFIPSVCVKDVQAFSGVHTYALKGLSDLADCLSGKTYEPLPSTRCHALSHGRGNIKNAFVKLCPSLSGIVGQQKAKRALEISAAGGHNLMLQGPPGAGKSLLAKAYRELLPDLPPSDVFDVTKIHTLSGKRSMEELSLACVRPFRAPHHTISYAGMLGGGRIPRPGEVSLAHKGVLFMDEFPEFSRQVVEALRQPLQEKCITISRSSGNFDFPADFTLLATCNPCPCGFFGHPRKECSCTGSQVRQYMKKLSGPILDRIDLFVFVNPVEISLLSKHVSDSSEDKSVNSTEPVSEIKQRIKRARELQKERFSVVAPSHSCMLNAQMTTNQVKDLSKIAKKARGLLDTAAVNLDISARGYFKLIKVARTIADLTQSERIEYAHMGEAISYRK